MACCCSGWASGLSQMMNSTSSSKRVLSPSTPRWITNAAPSNASDTATVSTVAKVSEGLRMRLLPVSLAM